MSKRLTMIGLLTVGLLTMLGATADAAWIYNKATGRMEWRSLDCIWGLKQVPSPGEHPALVECFANVASAEVLCENPANHNVAPGESATNTVLVGSNQIEEGDLTKKGGAQASVSIPQTVLDATFLKPEFCVNPNWTPIDLLVREVTANLNTYKCFTDDCSSKTLCSTATLVCSLPAEFNFDDYPNNLPPEGTLYDCTETVVQNSGCPVN